MSDYYDDSFESESGSENGEQREEGAGEGVCVPQQQSAVPTITVVTRELQVAPNLLANPRLSAALRGNGSSSDLDEQEPPSRWRSVWAVYYTMTIDSYISAVTDYLCMHGCSIGISACSTSTYLNFLQLTNFQNARA